MSVLNKRNALLGWATWQIGKSAMKYKVRSTARNGSKTKGAGAAAALLAAAGGAVVFWRRRRESEDD